MKDVRSKKPMSRELICTRVGFKEDFELDMADKLIIRRLNFTGVFRQALRRQNVARNSNQSDLWVKCLEQDRFTKTELFHLLLCIDKPKEQSNGMCSCKTITPFLISSVLELPHL